MSPDENEAFVNQSIITLAALASASPRTLQFYSSPSSLPPSAPTSPYSPKSLLALLPQFVQTSNELVQITILNSLATILSTASSSSLPSPSSSLSLSPSTTTTTSATDPTLSVDINHIKLNLINEIGTKYRSSIDILLKLCDIPFENIRYSALNLIYIMTTQLSIISFIIITCWLA